MIIGGQIINWAVGAISRFVLKLLLNKYYLKSGASQVTNQPVEYKNDNKHLISHHWSRSLMAGPFNQLDYPDRFTQILSPDDSNPIDKLLTEICMSTFGTRARVRWHVRDISSAWWQTKIVFFSVVVVVVVVTTPGCVSGVHLVQSFEGRREIDNLSCGFLWVLLWAAVDRQTDHWPVPYCDIRDVA